MKTLQALLLVFSLSLTTSESVAQINTPKLDFSLDSTTVSYQFGQGVIITDTVRGSIKNLTPDSVYFTLYKIGGNQWIIRSIINGKTIYWIQDTMVLGPSETLPINILFDPYPDGPDTENVCFTASPINGLVAESCVPTYILAASGVSGFAKSSDIVLMPNPARQFISVSGLSSSQTKLSYQIISVNGNEIEEGNLTTGDRIDIQEVPNGTYWIILRQSDGIVEEKAFTVLH